MMERIGFWGAGSSHWILLGAIVLLAGIYWALNYQPYILPNSDFFRIKAMSETLMSWQVPGDFKQMPLVPILMGPIALILPLEGDHFLHAISILNIALSMGSLVLLYFLSRALLGNMLALVPVVVLLATPQFTVSAHQPMLEPSIGFFSLATLVALAYRPRWAYLFAGLGALTRYEMALLLPVVFLVQVSRDPRHWFSVGLKCTVAGLPFVAWFGLSLLMPEEGNPYFGEMVRTSLLSVFMNMQSPFPAPKLLLPFIALAWSIGLIAAFRRNAPVALAILSFFLLYTLAHFIYGRPLGRYSYATLWVLPLLATVACHVLFRWARPILERTNRVGVLAVGSGMLVVLAYFIVRTVSQLNQGFPAGAVRPESWYLGWSFLCAGLVALVIWLSVAGPLRQRVLASLVVLTMVSIPFIGAGLSLARTSTAIYYEKADMVVASAWLAAHVEPGALVVMARHHELPYGMPNIDTDQSVSFGSFSAETHEEFVRELDRRGIEHVVFTHRPEKPDDPQHRLYQRNMQNYLGGKIYLMDPFRSGERVDGFERVAALPPPHPEVGFPVYIYKRNQQVPGSWAKTNE